MLKHMDGKWVALLLVVAVAIASNLLMAQQTRSAAASPAKVAVVDMEQVLEGLVQREQIEVEVRKQIEEFQNRFEKLRTEVQNLRADLDMLVPGNQDYQEKESELRLKAFQLKAFDDFKNASLSQEMLLQKVALYKKIADVSGQVARQQGYNLVLTKELPIDDPKQTPQQIQEAMQTRKVLWSDSSLDISNAVITQMNNEYNNRQTQ